MVHRFYMRRSFEDFDEKVSFGIFLHQLTRQLIAPTVLFITSKTEEESLKLRHIVNACLDKWIPGGEQWVIPEDKEVSSRSLAWPWLTTELPNPV